MTKYANVHYSCINWCPWPTLLPLYLLVRIGAVWQLAFYSHDENKFDQIFNHIMKLDFFQKLNCVWNVLFFNGYWRIQQISLLVWGFDSSVRSSIHSSLLHDSIFVCHNILSKVEKKNVFLWYACISVTMIVCFNR